MGFTGGVPVAFLCCEGDGMELVVGFVMVALIVICVVTAVQNHENRQRGVA